MPRRLGSKAPVLQAAATLASGGPQRQLLCFDIINLLIERNSYQRYLEIGVEGGEAVRAVRCALKTGVDPASDHATFQLPSDEFFAGLAADVEYDCIFVDGMHEEEQVLRDIENSLRQLSTGGTIVVHDVNPPSAWHQRDHEEAKQNGCRQWNGTVWRGWVRLRATRPDLRMLMVDTDGGGGIIQRCIDGLRSASREATAPAQAARGREAAIKPR